MTNAAKSPAVARLLRRLDELADESSLPESVRNELAALVAEVRSEDPVAAAFDRAREGFRRVERATR